MKARFHIPDFWKHGDRNLYLIDLIKKHPEYFYDDIEIASCYGCFAPALWNGGRTVCGSTSREQIAATIHEFNERGVPIRYTFTNPTITDTDLKDLFCNDLCKAANNGFNEIIVKTPCLENYIRSKYPQYPLVSSTVKQIEDFDKLMEEFKKDYKLVVLDYNWNNDFEKLDKIPQELRSRCEILINPYCNPHCPRRKEHYEVLGKCQRKCSTFGTSAIKSLRRGKPMEDPMAEAEKFDCPNTGFNFYQITGFGAFVSREDLFGRYMDMGFNNFKIEGRVLHPANVVESYVYYMVKPEYRDIVRLALLTYVPKKPLAAVKPKRYFVDYDGKEIPQKPGN